MLKELWQQLDKSAVIITPTTRLARYLQQAYRADYPASKPAEQVIITLQEWLNQLWGIYLKQTAQPYRLLTPWQSTIIWQDLIQQTDLNLLRPTALQRELQTAWQYLQQWQVPLVELQAFTQADDASDYSLAAQWIQQYHAYCTHHRCVDEDQLAGFLAEQLTENPDLQQQWILYGFDYVVPQLQSLGDHLCKIGANIVEYNLPALPQAHITYQSYIDASNELRAAAYWARTQSQKLNDQETIAVIIPDLSRRWLEVHNVFTEIFKEDKEPLFNIAGGLPLTDYPLIADTLLLLKSLVVPLPYAEISHLLRSPFWGGQEEYSKRALLTLKIANAGYRQMDLFSLAHFLQLSADVTDKKMLEYVSILLEEKQKLAKALLPSEWAKFFSAIVEKIEWGTGRASDSAEYQLGERWKILLEDLCSLDTVVNAPLSLTAILSVLQQQARTITFQPETKTARIHVMSVTDSASIKFAKIWVCGMTADAWPMPPKPNPFVPITLQKKYQTPHVTHQQEYLFAERFTKQWCHTAAEVFFSYPQGEGEIIYLPSSLIAQYAEAAQIQENFNLPWQKQIKPARLEAIEDHYGEPLVLSDKPIRGGSSLLQAQAECPFRAYAQYRLGLASAHLEAPPALGEPHLRGGIVHALLYLIWKSIGSSEQLQQLSNEALTALVEKNAEHVVNEFYTKEHKNLHAPPLFLMVEQERLIKLILLWLEKEKQRTSFTVHALEKTVKIELSGIKLTLRIDRVDQLPNGEYLIIDYKTSKQTSLGFVHERLIYPQLPMYALTEHQPLAGVVFAGLTPDNLGFSGLIEEQHSESLPKRTARSLAITSFEQQCEEWHEQLELLALEFEQGLASVTPYPTQQTCQRCNLNLLCRIGHNSTEVESNEISPLPLWERSRRPQGEPGEGYQKS
jgi:ATP-dependent helicase/nuclease subunit B